MYYQFWRMLLFWTVFSAVTSYYIYLATRPKLSPKTPRRVYKYLFNLYQATHVTTVIGAILSGIRFFDVHLFLFEDVQWWNEHYILSWFVPSPEIILFYGLYYGVMLRDLASLLATRMANAFEKEQRKFYQSYSRHREMCNLCQGPLSTVSEDEMLELQIHKSRFNAGEDDQQVKPEADEENITLNCGHTMHEFCLKGWIILGKKETCPVCKEKTDTSTVFEETAPWQADSPLYLNVLEMTRYLVVWNPIIIICVQILLKVMHATDQ